MKNDKVRFGLCVLFFVALAAITFRCVFGENLVFSASDLNIGVLANKKNVLPDALTGTFRATAVMGSTGYGLTFFNALLSILPLTVFANAFYGLILVFGSVAMVWFLRMWNRSWLSSVFGALVALWVNSVLLAMVGHAYKMEVLSFSIIGLCLIEKAVRAELHRRAVGYALLAGLAVGIMMIEQQDVALLAGLFLAPYALFRLVQVHGRKVLRWIAVLIPVGAVAVLLSGNTVLKSYDRNIKGAASVQQGGDSKWNYITQWSAVPAEWPDLIALGWSGWSTGNPEGPYWGKLGRSEEWEAEGKGFQNFKLNSVYFGVVPFLMGLFGIAAAFRNRKSEEAKVILFWSVAGLVGFWLAFGKYSILYKLFYHLPMVGNIRAPIKFFDNFQICLGIIAAYGLDGLINEGKRGRAANVLWIFGAACAGLIFLVAVKLMASPGAWQGRFEEFGFKSYADVLLQCMTHAWVHSGIFALLFAGLVFVVWKGIAGAKWAALGFIALIVADSLILTSKHFKADDISALKRGNNVINYLKAHQGDERIYFIDQSGIYNQWLASDGPYHGLNLFNIWQMPRMPVDYKEYLGTVGTNQIRLWQLSAIKYIAAPAGVLQQLKQNPQLDRLFTPVLNYQVPTAQGARPDVLLEFKGSIPRFALYQNWQSVPLDKHCETLVSPQHNPAGTVLVDASAGIGSHDAGGSYKAVVADLSRKKAVVQVDADSEAILRFSQRYNSGWSVFVDGKPADLLRTDYLCMGVKLPDGKHEVEFRCMNGVPNALLHAGILFGSIVGAVVLIRTKAGNQPE